MNSREGENPPPFGGLFKNIISERKACVNMRTKILIFSAAVLEVFAIATHNKVFSVLLLGVGITMIVDIIVKLIQIRRKQHE